MQKISSLILILAVVFLAQIVFAQDNNVEKTTEEAISLDENVKAEDLGIKEPKVLPNNPLYFFKNLARNVQAALTFNPIKKAEIQLKFANEKIIEAKKMAETTKTPGVVEKAIENYQENVNAVKNEVDKIKQTTTQNQEVGKFLDKFIKQQILQEKILEKLENQVSTTTAEKIVEAREQHLEKFGEVMQKLEEKNNISERLEKNLREMEGSQFKEFKNLEILKNLEEKVPEVAKEAIQKAQENTLTRLKENLEQMPTQTQEQFKSYLETISGEKEKQLQIMESLKIRLKETATTPANTKLMEKVEEGKTNILKKIEEKLEKIDCPLWETPAAGFCGKGVMSVEKDENGCPLPPQCVTPADIKCDVSVTCLEGYFPYNTGEKNTQGCPIIKCVARGTTEEKPIIKSCTNLWNPVCGKNGKTYSNKCFAESAGIEVGYEGACKEKIIEVLPIKENVACAQVITYCINPATNECTKYPDACSSPKPCQPCSGTLSPGPNPNISSCKDLWWFDNTHRECQQRKFCGAYMYLGLQTFGTKEECEQNLKGISLTCAKEGEKIGLINSSGMKLKCCEGLTPASMTITDNPDLCVSLQDDTATCIKCGDGICGNWEDKCSCFTDCK